MQLGQLLQDACEPHRARIGFQVSERCGGGHVVIRRDRLGRGLFLQGLEQRVQLLLGCARQTARGRLEYGMLIGLDRRAEEALQPSGGRWLQMLVAASVESYVRQVLEVRVPWEHLSVQPGVQRLAICTRQWTKAKPGADLCPVVFPRPAAPIVVDQGCR